MSAPLVLESTVRFRRCGKGRREVQPADATNPPAQLPQPVPRVARLMALAIHLDALLQAGEIKNHAELARLGQVSRARATQILNLLHLAPDIQEALLHLHDCPRGRGAILVRDLQPIVALLDWQAQRRRWRRLCQR
jgi:hypothetical protein